MTLRTLVPGLVVSLFFVQALRAQDCCECVCSTEPKVWGRSEYLFWFVKAARVPPLVTTGPFDPANPQDVAGEIGGPGTSILVGGRWERFHPSSGARFTLGGWLDACNQIGIE